MRVGLLGELRWMGQRCSASMVVLVEEEVLLLVFEHFALRERELAYWRGDLGSPMEYQLGIDRPLQLLRHVLIVPIRCMRQREWRLDEPRRG